MIPVWLRNAQSYIGTRELPGAKHNPKILEWWRKIRAPFTDDETPWCAAFVGGVFEEVGIISTRSAAARSYLKWGQETAWPVVGSVVVFWRGSRTSATGHVGFVVGRDKDDNLMVLGGNQGDTVCIKPFPRYRVLSYRWPLSAASPQPADLPLMSSDGIVSSNEA